MAGISETGHLKIVTNFESLITSATAFGASYNPSTAAIKLLALQTPDVRSVQASTFVVCLLTVNCSA